MISKTVSSVDPTYAECEWCQGKTGNEHHYLRGCEMCGNGRQAAMDRLSLAHQLSEKINPLTHVRVAHEIKGAPDRFGFIDEVDLTKGYFLVDMGFQKLWCDVKDISLVEN